MRFGLLGPVEVRCDGRPIAVGGGRERLVLAALLLHADHLTLTSQLIGWLWERPPTTAKAQVHNMISRLRQRLGADDLIVSRPGGYELRLGRHELDLVEFRELVRRGRQACEDGEPQLGVTLFRTALTLWRGPALTDVAEEFVADLRHSLHEERLAAAEAKLSAEVALGRHDDVLRDLTGLIVDHPYRERLHEIKMMALAGAGRRADALAAYQHAYRCLAEELGMAPGRALRELEQRILRGDTMQPSRSVGRPVPRQLPPTTSVVAGREALLGELRAELSREPPAPTIALVGPAGVGKTTVALAAARSVRERYPDGQLYADLRGSRSSPADPHSVAGRLLRDLGMDGASLPEDPDERVAMYRSCLADRRMLVVLDDAADEAQVRSLLPGATGCATVVTSRRRLCALIGVTRRTVAIPPPEVGVALLGSVIGTERVAREPAAARAIVTLCGNLPLAVCAAAARLSTNADWTLEDFRRRLARRRGRLDELAVGDLDVRASIARGYQALEPPLRALFRRLALIGAASWPAWIPRLLLGTVAESRVERMLDRLVDVHLVEALGRDEYGQPRFALHELVREFGRERAMAEDAPSVRAETWSAMLSGRWAIAARADERIDHGSLVPAGPEVFGTMLGDADAARQAPLAWFDRGTGRAG